MPAADTQQLREDEASPVTAGVTAAVDTATSAIQQQGLAGLNKTTLAKASTSAMAAMFRASCQKRAGLHRSPGAAPVMEAQAEPEKFGTPLIPDWNEHTYQVH